MERFDTIKFTAIVLLISAVQFTFTYIDSQVPLWISLFSGHILIFLSFLIFSRQNLTIKKWVVLSVSYILYPLVVLLLFNLIDFLSQSIFEVYLTDNQFINAMIFGLVTIGNFLFTLLTVTVILRIEIKRERLVFFIVVTFLAFMILVLGDWYEIPDLLGIDIRAGEASGIIVLNLLFLLSCYGTFHVKRKGANSLIRSAFPLFSTTLFFVLVFYLAYYKPFESDCDKISEAKDRLGDVINATLERVEEMEKGYPDLRSSEMIQIRDGVFKYIDDDNVKKIDERSEVLAKKMEEFKDVMVDKEGNSIDYDDSNEVIAEACTRLLKHSEELANLTEERSEILLDIYEKRLEIASRKF